MYQILKKIKKKIFGYFKFIKWSTISLFGNNKIINRSYIYLFIVPTFAKLFSKIESPLIIEFNEYKFNLVFELPFTWQLFFWSAIFFTIGTIIYNLRAPKIIKENTSFADFIKERKNFNHLESYIKDLGFDENWLTKMQFKRTDFGESLTKALIYEKTETAKEFDIYKIKFYNNFIKNLVGYNTKYNTQIPDRDLGMPVQRDHVLIPRKITYEQETYLGWSFWSLYEYANSDRIFELSIAYIFFTVGFLLIGCIIIQSIIVVYNFPLFW